MLPWRESQSSGLLQLRDKLAAMELSNREVTARERRREAAGLGVESPWFVRTPYAGGWLGVSLACIALCPTLCVSAQPQAQVGIRLSCSSSLCCSPVLAAGRCVPQPPHTALLVSQLLRHGCALLSAICIVQSMSSDPGFPSARLLETVARMPYFSYISMLHLYVRRFLLLVFTVFAIFACFLLLPVCSHCHTAMSARMSCAPH